MFRDFSMLTVISTWLAHAHPIEHNIEFGVKFDDKTNCNWFVTWWHIAIV
jgi:hypothetical protein